MDFDALDSNSAFRREIVETLDQIVSPDLISRCRETGTLHDWNLHKKMGQLGWFGRGWPAEYGGDGNIGSSDAMVLKDELGKRGAPVDGMVMTLMIARVILEVGTEELRRSFIPPALRGDIVICVGYTEAHGGSDIAGARTTAVRDGESWIINGHKMFTTLAHESDYVFLLTRTDPDAPKHRGLTLFLVPINSPGVEIQPIYTIGDERTNATYYSDVVVPDSARVGDVNEGWRILNFALMHERVGWSDDVRLFRLAVSAARQTKREDGTRLIEDAAVRERLARMAIERGVAMLLGRRSQWATMKGSMSLVEGSMFKLFSAETEVRAAADLIDIFGPEGAIEATSAEAPGDGEFVHEYRHSIVRPIYAGSSEVQRRIIAERGLGLPPSKR